LVITVNSSEVAADGAISTTFTVADPMEAPLDRLGVTTPGAIALSFVAAYIPVRQQQYVAYTARRVSGAALSSAEQAASDTGGTYTTLSEGRYRYVFGTKAPSRFDRSLTHTIGVYGSRNLQELELGTNYASTTFNFVPAGEAVSTVRELIKTQSCNKCHDEPSAHGRSRRGLELCILCHTPQTTDPDTGTPVWT
jgi:OmcA/MtrC family decaheme c-type cytochrome